MNKKVRFFFTVVLIVASSSSMFAAGAGEKEDSDAAEPLEIMCGVPMAPPALPLLRMIEINAMGKDVKLEYTLWSSPEQLIGMLQGSEGDMFALPLTVAAKLYNKGMPFKMTNVNTWGVTYFTTTDPEFDSWADLEGETVYIPLRSSPPDLLTLLFLENAGLDLKTDVNIVYSTQAEIANLMAAGEIEYATQIEPQCTMSMMKNADVRSVYSFTDCWQDLKQDGSDQPNAGWALRSSFLEAHPEVIARFEREYKKALEWVAANPGEAAQLAHEKLDMPAAVFAKGIPRMGIKYQSAQDAKDDCTALFELLYNANPKSVGGKIPDDGLYYEGQH
jgi:NitT/TauT family transport system substrate-binding protein